MNKKIIITIIFLVVLSVGVLIFFTYLHLKQQPIKEVSEKALTTSVEELKSIASQEFLKELEKESSPSNPAYLEAVVKDYKTSTTVSEVKIIEQGENTAKTEIQLQRIITNTKTNFTTINTEIYQVSLKKQDGEWKVDNIELISSETT